MRRRRAYTWYVEPLSDFTNQAIAGEVSEEHALRDVTDADGVPHNVWRCPRALVTRLLRDGSSRHLFHVFCREGNGKMRRFLFDRSAVQRAVRKIAAR